MASLLISTAAPVMRPFTRLETAPITPLPRFEMRVRLESVDNAFEQRQGGSAQSAGSGRRPMTAYLGSGRINSTASCSSWGLSQGHDQQVTRGDPKSRHFSVCYLKGGELLAVEAINHAKDYMAARKLIADR